MIKIIEKMLNCRCTDLGPNQDHDLRDLGTLIGETVSYKFVSDHDYIYANNVAICSTFNDQSTAGEVFISLMSASGPSYVSPY